MTNKKPTMLHSDRGVTIGEVFGFGSGGNVEKKLAAGLRKLGVDYVFDTIWAVDLTIME